MHVSSFVLLVSLGLTCSGCKSYDPKPVSEVEILRELQAIRLETLHPVSAGEPAKGDTGPPRFDPVRGLAPDDAVAVALYLNPELRAFRLERGVSEGELVAAGVLPNPNLQVSYLFLDTFTKSLGTSAFGFGLNWSPPRPGEVGAKQARAEARIEEVRAQVAGAEWLLASDVRKAYVALWAAGERLRVFDASLRLRERIRNFVRSKRELGDANKLDLNLVEIEYVDAVRERAAAANEHERVQLELNRLLGLPPLAEFVLQATEALVAYRPFKLAARELELVMVEHRPDLRAAKHEYEQAEESLRLAYIERIPWFTFGPAIARDELNGKVQNRFGLTLGIDLPIANQNEGEIAVREAAREKLGAGFVAKVHQARAEVNEALRAVNAQERLIAVFQDSMKAALEENAALTESAFDKGEINLVQLVATQDKVLKSRREFLESRLDYWRAVFDLERALGERVSSGKE
jgi:outer membrane protein TolC